MRVKEYQLAIEERDRAAELPLDKRPPLKTNEQLLREELRRQAAPRRNYPEGSKYA